MAVFGTDKTPVGKSVSDAEINMLLRGPESDTLAFREGYDLDESTGRVAFLKDVGAFANASGGHIAIGVDPGGRALGTPITFGQQALARLAKSFYGLRVDLDLTVRHLAGGDVGWLYIFREKQNVLTVPGGTELLGQAAKAGEPPLEAGDVYFRHDGETRRAQAGELAWIMDKIISGRGYQKVHPPWWVSRPVSEPVVKPSDPARVLSAVSSGKRSDMLEFHSRLELDDPAAVGALLRDVAGLANARGGHVAFLSAAPDLDRLGARFSRLAVEYLGDGLGLEWKAAELPDSRWADLLYVPAVAWVVAFLKPGPGFREGDVFYREGATTVKAETRHYDQMVKKICAAKDFFIIADRL